MGKIEQIIIGAGISTIFLGGFLTVQNSRIKNKIVDRTLVAMDTNRDGVTSLEEQKGHMPNAIYCNRVNWDGSEDSTIRTDTRSTGQKLEYKGRSPPWFNIKDCQKYLDKYINSAKNSKA